jgi:flagellar biosynthetic protein FliP
MSEAKQRRKTSLWSRMANCTLHTANCKLPIPFIQSRRLIAAKPIAAAGNTLHHKGRFWTSKKILAYLAIVVVCFSFFGSAGAQETSNQPLTMKLPDGLAGGPKTWTSPEGLSATIQVMLLLTVLSLAPAILLMTTCFVRIVVVLSLLRQAVGTQQLPPSQVITTLSLFLTFLIMAPVWKQVYTEAVVPYTEHRISLDEAWKAGVAPVRRFMSQQIERTKNSEDVYLFLNYMPNQPTPTSYDDVPLLALLPAFMLSELKTAFLIGFQIYLPFLILDIVISSVLVSMGMLMLPPVLISLPFKLLLFVLVDGWHLVVGMLLESFQPFT